MDQHERIIFTGMLILHGQTWVEDHALIVEAGKIKAIIPDNMISHHLPAKTIKLKKEMMLVPGLIDLHIHGARGSDVMDANDKALATISQALAEEGVTGYLATTMTAPKQDIESVLAFIPKAMQQKTGAKILGVHLEGPFVSAAKHGAQHPQNLLSPNVELFKSWQALSQNAIKLVTLAPELEDADKFIVALCEMGVVAAIGHSDATYAQTMDAIKAGCSHATHLFNAMRGMHQREPGASGALLLADMVTADLIVDGVHLHPAMVELAYRVKGNDRLMLISDAMRAKCMSNGQYDLGGQQVNVKNGRAMLEDGTLAGSLLKLPQAIKNMMRYSTCTLIDAIRMASFNPARKLKIDSHKGSIEVGKDADLILLTPDLDVQLTMREGEIIFAAT